MRAVLREATLEDTPALVRMAEHFIRGTAYADLLTFNEPAIHTLIALVLGHGVIYVTEIDRALVGMIAIVALPHPVTGELYADELAWWVEPAYRGTSVGPHLLDAAERWALARGAAMMKMIAPVGSSVGAYYLRRGYRPIEIAYGKVLHGRVLHLGADRVGAGRRDGGLEPDEPRAEPLESTGTGRGRGPHHAAQPDAADRYVAGTQPGDHGGENGRRAATQTRGRG